ncbi:hypothetical protein I316_01847 [Kwoniella heveanensis BCC8398]|uniref:Uncharacterized protein n=1 Tax=Kwoniella heveanensis BCC8398 TaxID=1296120 RepID=A0A1B9GZZ1_9TREE|nr:hypothetical protein I316_01847 [Kwoniella heveanensis BCC8398]
MALVVGIFADRRIRDLIERSSATHTLGNIDFTIWADDLNAVNHALALAAGRAPGGNTSASRPSLRFLATAIKEHPGNMSIRHVEAHTDDTAEEAKLNDRADTAAKQARSVEGPIRLKDAYCDPFALLTKEEGITHEDTNLNDPDDDALEDLERAQVEILEDDNEASADNEAGVNNGRANDGDAVVNEGTHEEIIETNLRFRMAGVRRRPIPKSKQRPDRSGARYHNTYLFTRARSAATSERGVEDKFLKEAHASTCYLCPASIGAMTERHRFVECPAWGDTKNKMTDQVLEADRAVELIDAAEHKALAEAMPKDGDLWHNQRTRYWLGLLPAHFEYKAKYDRLYGRLA